VFTTFIQVLSRLTLVWGVCDAFPAETQTSTAYSTMVLAWSITEVVRYSFYFTSLRGSVPSVLQWLRYNTFLVLYPLGVGSEMTEVWKAIPEAELNYPGLGYGFYAILASYAPGFYVLFGYMLKQRRRLSRGKGVKRG
jgi:very-long-chain (3R)-3-hydroxyacyl-CoA dehydratase